MTGQTVGGYRIVKQLGEGAMGAVYLAEHARLRHQMAVKVFKTDFCRRPDGNVDEQTLRDAMKRFFNEAQIASHLDHPGIVKVTDYGTTESGSAYYVMELLRGQSLASRLRAGAISVEHAIRLAKQAGGALARAHELGIVHRDLKPDNIFLVPDADVAGGERVKILDFGIAKLRTSTFESGVQTRFGTQMGTPYYMSPEQWTNAAAADQRADVYSMSCVLFELLCGRPPFTRPSLHELMYCHLNVAPESPATINPAVSAPLCEVVLRGLAKKPEDRQQSMQEWVEAIERASAAGALPATLVATAPSPAASTGRIRPAVGPAPLSCPQCEKSARTFASICDACKRPLPLLVQPRWLAHPDRPPGPRRPASPSNRDPLPEPVVQDLESIAKHGAPERSEPFFGGRTLATGLILGMSIVPGAIGMLAGVVLGWMYGNDFRAVILGGFGLGFGVGLCGLLLTFVAAPLLRPYVRKATAGNRLLGESRNFVYAPPEGFTWHSDSGLLFVPWHAMEELSFHAKSRREATLKFLDKRTRSYHTLATNVLQSHYPTRVMVEIWDQVKRRVQP